MVLLFNSLSNAIIRVLGGVGAAAQSDHWVTTEKQPGGT